MTDSLPITRIYNLARLGNAGDAVRFAADEAQRAVIARWSDVLSLEAFAVQVDICKLDATRFGLDFTVTADVTQACVVSLDPVPAEIRHQFNRELHFSGPSRRKPVESEPAEAVLDMGEEEGPEEIESLHYDLAAPALEEYLLCLDPYPRRKGVEFAGRDTDPEPPQSPFAVLKGLKSGS